MTSRAVAQVVVATVPAGMYPVGIAANTATNKTYVTNLWCIPDSPPCPGPGTVTVIDGATNNTTTVNVGLYPYAVAVNPVTNKIYVANACGNDVNCGSFGTVTVIDGTTNNTSTVNVGAYPYALDVNSGTNKIYVANECGDDPTCQSTGTVTVIDGATNNVLTTVTVGYVPDSVAVNSVTNQIYVANNCGSDITCSSIGTATVIDGVSNNTAAVTVGFLPYYVALNSTTNKVYVSNDCGNDITCSSLGTATVIDANNNNSTATVNVGAYPFGLAVDATTNHIYVVNACGNDLTCSSLGTVTVIDGAGNNTKTVSVGAYPNLVAVNPITNQIFVPNECGNDLTCSSAGTVAVIDGATNSTVPVAAGDGAFSVAVNSATNTIYVPNAADGTVSVIAGGTTLQLTNVTPCRLVDTRLGSGGGGPIQGGTFQTFNLPQLAQSGKFCPGFSLATAASYSLNVTLIPSNGPVGYLTIWPASQGQPDVSTMNSDGRIKANAAIVSAGVSGAVSVFVANTADVLLDIDGYFPPASQSTLAFYPLTPCRVADTRNPDGPLGGPYLMGMVNRDFPVLEATSCFPSGVTPVAYSLNFTAVPHGSLGYLTVCPTPSDPSQNCPLVSTLNSYGGQVTANGAIVPTGLNGVIRTFPSDDTDLIIDINGYFGAPGPGGLSLYPTVPCRALDTRLSSGGNGPFQFELEPPVDVLRSPCGVPSQSMAYVFNATVVPQGPLDYLALWPDGQNQPVVSTLNAYDGVITSNMAIVFAGATNGKVDAYANPVNQNDPSDITDLLLDISSYFAP